VVAAVHLRTTTPATPISEQLERLSTAWMKGVSNGEASV
jgi:hypothetical protein